MARIRVLVVEDSLTVRKRIVEVLAADPDIEVVGEADDGKVGIELCQQLRPNVITLDMMLPVMSGLAATEFIMAYCPTPILILSASINRGELFRTYEALAAGAPVLCDSSMVAAGITRLSGGNEVVSLIADPRAAEAAARLQTTRSAAAVELSADRIGGAVLAIGNAPTALFRLLELVDDGLPAPAAVLGGPVGFVGSTQSKQELIARPRGISYLLVTGRRGGSAMAAAAVNAIAGGAA